jgi:hypothetical protein
LRGGENGLNRENFISKILSLFEISSKKSSGGQKYIKLILHEIMPDDTVWQENGISWKEEYCKTALESVNGTPIVVEFINEDKSEIWGHGLTDVIETDEGKLPIFENSEQVGTLTGGYIDDIEIDGITKRVCIAEGKINRSRYNNLYLHLQENVPAGNISGSVEIMGLPDNDNKIIYEDGYKEFGRVPQNFIYSGFALLGSSVKPADPVAKVLEINENQNVKKEDADMDEKILAQLVENIKNTIVEINSKNSEYEAQISEKDAKIVELNASVEQLEAALMECKKELNANWEKNDVLYKEMEMIKGEMAKAHMKEKVGEMNSAIADFTDEEKAYAKEEIDAFNAEPLTHEINTIVNKIYAEIGKKNKEVEAEEKRVSELNSKENKPEDIFSEVVEINNNKEEDTNIF